MTNWLDKFVDGFQSFTTDLAQFSAETPPIRFGRGAYQRSLMAARNMQVQRDAGFSTVPGIMADVALNRVAKTEEKPYVVEFGEKLDAAFRGVDSYQPFSKIDRDIRSNYEQAGKEYLDSRSWQDKWVNNRVDTTDLSATSEALGFGGYDPLAGEEAVQLWKHNRDIVSNAPPPSMPSIPTQRPRLGVMQGYVEEFKLTPTEDNPYGLNRDAVGPANKPLDPLDASFLGPAAVRTMNPGNVGKMSGDDGRMVEDAFGEKIYTYVPLPGSGGGIVPTPAFEGPADGMRYLGYWTRHRGIEYGESTLRDLASKWWNDGGDYTNWLRNVSSISGVSPSTKITRENIPSVVKGILGQENGQEFASAYGIDMMDYGKLVDEGRAMYDMAMSRRNEAEALQAQAEEVKKDTARSASTIATEVQSIVGATPDGNLGPATRLAMENFLADRGVEFDSDASVVELMGKVFVNQNTPVLPPIPKVRM